MSGSAEPPPSYEEAQGMITGPGQYPPQQQPYQEGKVDVYSGNPPNPTQPGQPAPYPVQQGYAPYPYGQPAVPPQGVYPPGTYVHPTVGYSPATGAVVQNQGPVSLGSGTFGTATQQQQAQRKKWLMITVMLTVIILIFFIIMFSVAF